MLLVVKSRKQKSKIYYQKYNDIPRDYQERINYIIDKYHFSQKDLDRVITTRNQMLQELYLMPEIFVVLYEEPEGSPRPRARYVNKHNLSSAAKSDPGHIQVYSITGASDKRFMKQLITDQEFNFLDSLIYTPCFVDYTSFHRIPSNYSKTEVMLAEMGIIRPPTKPDFDNIEKKYADMYTENIWLDDNLVISATINKYYSILPRIEIRLRYLNMLYNKHQYQSMKNKLDKVGITEAKFFQYRQ